METQIDIRSAIDAKAISKKHDPTGRDETAHAIVKTREEARLIKEDISRADREIGKMQALSEDLVRQYVEKARLLRKQQAKFLVRLRKRLGIRDNDIETKKANLSNLQIQEIDVSLSVDRTQAEQEKLETRSSNLSKDKEILKAYYEKTKNTPLSNEEKRELLKPKVLAELNKEEYIALWRRLNPYFLAHVTRQGFRDHTGDDIMVNHNSGYHEFINGFTSVMENGRSIFPPLARIGLIDRKETTIKAFLSKFMLKISTAEETKKRFKDFLNNSFAAAPNYPDITATHLAAQIVSDRHYGGEKDFTRPQSEVKWNDVFVWTDPNHPGIPIDSGLVFLPEKTPVDPDSGSKYASEIKIIGGEEERVTIEDTSLVSSFIEWAKKLDDQSPLKKAFLLYKEERNYNLRKNLKESCLAIFSQELQTLGVPADVSPILTDELIGELHFRDSLSDETLKEMMENSGANLKRAVNTIPSNEYWENFFAKNPNLRPKHIHYYNGDPTAAVLEFHQQNGIGKTNTSTTDEQLLGFDDHHVLDMENDPRANLGYDELIAMANKIIDDHYKAEAQN